MKFAKICNYASILKVLTIGALAIAVSQGEAATVSIDAVYFAQTHVQKPTQSYFRLVANRNTLLKVHVVSPETPAAPPVSAFLSLSGQTTNLTLTGPAVLPASIADGPGVVQHTYSNSFTALIPRTWVKSGLSVTVSAGTNQIAVTNLLIGAPTKLIMNMFDVQYFADTSGDYPAGWQQEIEAKWPIAEYEVRRLRHVVFPELVIPPRAGVPAARVKSTSDYAAQTGLAFDGEQGAALAWNGALKAAAGKSGRISYYYINIYGVNAGGQAGGFGGVGNGTSLGIFHHESGHALSLPHWGDSTSYPYKGDMYGITAPAIYNATHAGPTWAFDLRTMSFIPCTAQSNNISGHPAGTYKADPMQGGGTGWQEPGYLLNHFSDYSANQARNYLEGHVLVWNTNLGQYASWNQAANGYTTTVANNGVSYPVVRDTSVISILASVSGANTNVNMVYPPIGPYTTGLIKRFDPTIPSERAEAASIFAPAGGCDVSVRVIQGGAQKTYMLAASWDPSADPLAGGSLQTAAINLPASNGVVTKVELLLTPDAQVNGLPANPQVLYTWPASLIAVPTNLKAASSNSLIKLTWNASSGATSYRLKRSNVSGGPYTLITSTGGTSYNDTQVTNGVTYFYVVSATNSIGESLNSSEAAAALIPISANATLANLVPSAGALTPSFSSFAYAYSATVPFSISNITVMPTSVAPSATIRVNGNLVASGTASSPISLGVGATNVIATAVVSADTTQTNTYTLTVTRTPTVPDTRWWDGGTVDIGTNGNGASAGTAGTWDATIQNWDQGNGLAHVAWNNAGNDVAFFAGTAGTVNLGTNITVSGLTFTTSGYVLASNSLTFNYGGVISNTVTATISSVITGPSPIIKTGAGTLTVGGANTYSGNTYASGGILDLGAISLNSFGGGSGRNIFVSPGAAVRRATLDNAFMIRLAETTNEIAVMTGTTGNSLDFSGSNGGANLPNAFLGNWYGNSAKCDYTGTLTPASDAYRLGSPTSAGLLGMVTPLTGDRGLIVGGNRVQLTATNTFTGDTVIRAGGRLFLGKDLALQNSALDTDAGNGTLTLSDGTGGGGNATPGVAAVPNPTLGGLKGSRALASVINQSAGGNNAGVLPPASITGFTLNPGFGKSCTYSGPIADLASGTTALALTKTGAGTQILTGVNTYTGTTAVNGGKLLVNSPGSLAAASAVTVNTNGTFGGNGTVNGSVAVADGGNLSPGASLGTLTIGGGLDISAQAAGDDGKLIFELDTTNSNDRIVVAGTLNIGAGVLGFSDFVFVNLGGLENGIYKLITSGSISGTLDSQDATGDLGDGYGTVQISGTNLVLLVTGIGGSPASSNAFLNSMGLNPAGTLSPGFSSNVFSYAASEAYGVAPTVTVVNADLTATNHLIYDGTTNFLASGTPSSPLLLALGITNPVVVRVTAQDGVTVNTYTVNVTMQPNLTPPSLTSLVSGTTLSLSWPADRLGYALQRKTNALNAGLNGGTWMPVPGSSSVTSTNLPIDTNPGTVFYRLVYP